MLTKPVLCRRKFGKVEYRSESRASISSLLEKISQSPIHPMMTIDINIDFDSGDEKHTSHTLESQWVVAYSAPPSGLRARPVLRTASDPSRREVCAKQCHNVTTRQNAPHVSMFVSLSAVSSSSSSSRVARACTQGERESSPTSAAAVDEHRKNLGSLRSENCGNPHSSPHTAGRWLTPV